MAAGVCAKTLGYIFLWILVLIVLFIGCTIVRYTQCFLLTREFMGLETAGWIAATSQKEYLVRINIFSSKTLLDSTTQLLYHPTVRARTADKTWPAHSTSQELGVYFVVFVIPPHFLVSTRHWSTRATSTLQNSAIIVKNDLQEYSYVVILLSPQSRGFRHVAREANLRQWSKRFWRSDWRPSGTVVEIYKPAGSPSKNISHAA